MNKTKLDLAQFQGFTPGPWSLVRNVINTRLDHARIDGPNGLPLAHVNVHQQLSEREENARLIAAAPALLELAREQQQQIERLRVALEGMLAQQRADWNGCSVSSTNSTISSQASAALEAE